MWTDADAIELDAADFEVVGYGAGSGWLVAETDEKPLEGTAKDWLVCAVTTELVPEAEAIELKLEP